MVEIKPQVKYQIVKASASFNMSILFFLLVLFNFSCDKKDTQTFISGVEFYPLHPGHFITYSVDSFYYSATNYPTIAIDTIHYEIKELIDTSFIDNEGRTSYRIERYRRPDALSNWTIDRIWSANNNDIMLDKNEDDLHFIKLVFPIIEGKTWKGNRQIAAVDDNTYLKDWTYEYQNLNQSFTIANETFDSTVLVLQIDDENLIEKKYAYEIYAKGVGMIAKELKFLGKQRDLSNGWEYPETGVWVRYIYSGHGQE